MYNGVLRNLRAFIAAAITVIVALAAIELSVRSALSNDATADWDYKDFFATERDDHGRLVAEVNAIAASEARPSGSVFLVGGSTVREGLVPDPVIQEALDAHLGADAPTFRTLYSFDQSLAETARVVTNLPLTAGDTVVIGINPRRFSFGRLALANEAASSRLSLLDGSGLSAIADDQRVADALRASTDSYRAKLDDISSSRLFSPWDSLAVFEHRLFLRNWFEGRLSAATTQSWGNLTSLRLADVQWGSLIDLSLREVRQPIRYGFGAEALTDTKKDEIARIVAEERVPAYFEHADVDFALLAALADQVTSSGAELILLELPRSAASSNAYGPVWDDYDPRVDELATAAGATRIDLRSLQFDDDEFFDLEHLLSAARPRLTDAVVDALLDVDLGLAS